MARSRPARRRILAIEQLHARQLMAADLITVGAFCSEMKSSTSAANIVSLAASKDKPTYTYSVVGDPLDSPAVPSAGLALMGGGTDVDAAFKWMGDHANGGDFVILSTSKNSYAKYINGLSTLNSVATLVVPDVSSANDPFVAQVVSTAEAVFIAGGDQANYITNWTGSALEAAIYSMLSHHGVLGGTSAGLAVLGDVDYAALNDSTTSAEALANPLTSSITLDSDFITPDEEPGSPLSYLQETITDSHFMQRDRMGRTMAFMARADYENKVDNFARAIAVNEQTALLIDGNGQAIVVGNQYAKKGAHYDQQRSVYIMDTTQPANLTGGPLNYTVQVQRLTYDPLANSSDMFDFVHNSSTNADHYSVGAVGGVLDADMLGNPNVAIYGPAIA